MALTASSQTLGALTVASGTGFHRNDERHRTDRRPDALPASAAAGAMVNFAAGSAEPWAHPPATRSITDCPSRNATGTRPARATTTERRDVRASRPASTSPTSAQQHHALCHGSPVSGSTATTGATSPPVRQPSRAARVRVRCSSWVTASRSAAPQQRWRGVVADNDANDPAAGIELYRDDHDIAGAGFTAEA